MPNVLIIGATGTVGLPLAQSLTRSGNYTVYGLARSAVKAKVLAQSEIIPVIGDVADANTWTPLLASAPIDIVVDTSSAYQHQTAILDGVTAHARTRATTLQGEGLVHSRLGFIYVSGTWVHGSPDHAVSDLHPVGSKTLSATPASIVAWRPAHEQRVLAAGQGPDAVLDVAVVRPAEVYGGPSATFAPIFQPLVDAKKAGGEATVKVPLTPGASLAVVHVDDVVDGLHRVVDGIGGGRLGSWPVFDLVAETVTLETLAEAGKQALGIKGAVEAVGTGGDVMLEAISTRAKVRAERASIVLGWVPKRRNVLGDVERLLAAFEAHAS